MMTPQSLYAALYTFHETYKNPVESSDTYYDVLHAVSDTLLACGLLIYHSFELRDGSPTLNTCLAHISGQKIDSASTIHYQNTDYERVKRDHVILLLGLYYKIDPGIREYNDKGLKTYDPKLTPDRYKDLLQELQDYDFITQGILDTYSVESLAHLPNDDYFTILKKVRSLKQSHDALKKG